jgi:hypothetical protein
MATRNHNAAAAAPQLQQNRGEPPVDLRFLLVGMGSCPFFPCGFLSVFLLSLQLVGVSALLIACKYKEIWGLEVGTQKAHLYFSVLMVELLNICVLFQVNDFIQISAYAYSREQILSMEKGILNRLEWNITVPTPYVFLARFLKVASLGVKTTRR